MSLTITVNDINNMIDDQIEKKWFITDSISDGYHTFWELYKHRVALFIALCNTYTQLEYHPTNLPVWKSKLHSDRTMPDWCFVAWIGTDLWKQITYHIPLKCWDDLNCCICDKAPESDWHTSNDVTQRLLDL